MTDTSFLRLNTTIAGEKGQGRLLVGAIRVLPVVKQRARHRPGRFGKGEQPVPTGQPGREYV